MNNNKSISVPLEIEEAFNDDNKDYLIVSGEALTESQLPDQLPDELRRLGGFCNIEHVLTWKP